MVVLLLRPSGRGRGGAAANGRLVDWTVCSSAWRTWTRSTWSETSGAPDSAAPSTAPGGAALKRASSGWGLIYPVLTSRQRRLSPKLLAVSDMGYCG